ncbi:hypothetical protein TTRE_0000549901 [Trichuris trichiura]|uniref:Uncharacterized protein n=1 Tax=Trichuris trichiura TaxID=36087 RepID=A0A077ZCG2_TRITR|nr:hypothetical protein TTRE_0000549901 [Trichuris trichiura]
MAIPTRPQHSVIVGLPKNPGRKDIELLPFRIAIADDRVKKSYAEVIPTAIMFLPNTYHNVFSKTLSLPISDYSGRRLSSVQEANGPPLDLSLMDEHAAFALELIKCNLEIEPPQVGQTKRGNRRSCFGSA